MSASYDSAYLIRVHAGQPWHVGWLSSDTAR
jgi:hypothetical protein